MQRIVTAVYENGVLRLLDPLELPEHTYVQLHIQELSNANDAQVEHRQQLRQALVGSGLSVPATNAPASNHVPLSAERREQLAEVFSADYSLSSSIIEDREGR